MFPQDDTGYLVTFVCRKVVIALVASGRASVDWQTMSRDELREVCCDQSEFLATFDEKWSAADVSNFIFGRPDWGIFVSLFACLWKDTDVTTKRCKEKLVQGIESGAFERAAATLRSAVGHNVHPALVVQKLREKNSL